MDAVIPSPTTEEHVTVESRRKRIVAIGVAVALAVTGGGAAFAATSGNDQRDALLRDAAQRLDVSPGELRAALEGAFGDQLDQAVRAGRLTQEQADDIKERIARYGVLLGGPLDGPRHGFGGPGHGPFGIGLDAAADYLGLTEAQLERRLTNGRTLAEVARAEGKTVDGLEQALVDAARTRLDRAVADRDLTATERDRILSDVEEHVEDLVTGSAPGPFGRHRGPGGPGGPPPFGGFHEHP